METSLILLSVFLFLEIPCVVTLERLLIFFQKDNRFKYILCGSVRIFESGTAAVCGTVQWDAAFA